MMKKRKIILTEFDVRYIIEWDLYDRGLIKEDEFVDYILDDGNIEGDYEIGIVEVPIDDDEDDYYYDEDDDE